MPRDASAPALLPAAPVLAAIRALLHLSALALLTAAACDPARQKAPEPEATTPAPAPPAASTGVTSDLKSDEDLRLLPAVALRDGDGWRVDLRAWVFEPEEGSWRRGAAVEALVSALELPPGSEANEVFRKRARAFLVDNESGKRVVVRISSRNTSSRSPAPTATARPPCASKTPTCPQHRPRHRRPAARRRPQLHWHDRPPRRRRRLGRLGRRRHHQDQRGPRQAAPARADL
ncbi:hypothetical protein [Nannocystis pusilla]|uniref:hypothetical protein n=1 Tax=Nannocystis pusilla TaxID=889268 RepID=UPI003B7CD308